MEQFDLRIILIVVGVLTLITGLITEILKQFCWNIMPTNLVALLVAEFLTLVSGLIYSQIAGTVVLWWHVLAALIAGRFVACSAMYSYDKMLQASYHSVHDIFHCRNEK